MKKTILGIFAIQTIVFSWDYYEKPPETSGYSSSMLSEYETKQAVRDYNEIRNMSGSEYDYNYKVDAYNRKYGGKSAYDAERATQELNRGYRPSYNSWGY
jgi:uncharacterized protein YxeA